MSVWPETCWNGLIPASVAASVRIPAGCPKTREALCQYIARPPVSLKKLLIEDHAGTVLYYTAYNPYFRTNAKYVSRR